MNATLNLSIIDLDNVEARQLLMQPSSYCTMALPGYIDFTDALLEAGKAVGSYHSSCITLRALKKSKKKEDSQRKFPDDSATLKSIVDGVNYRILQNKDGLLSWRPMELINPLIYAVLVNKLTEEDNWKIIQKRFLVFRQAKYIQCCSMPRGEQEQATQKGILNWWTSFEQRSIALSLEFEYMGKTDISDCYGSIYTHSIPWALHEKKVAKAAVVSGSGQKLLGDEIDELFQDMHSCQTVGIPQGSVLSDLIAELILGYADSLLSEELSDINCEYRILRYRDDYRIFANSQALIHTILLRLMKVLSGLNFKLASAKTCLSEDVVLGSVKPDKVAWLLSRHGGRNAHKRLLALGRFARDYPQSGTLVRELQRLSRDIERPLRRVRRSEGSTVKRRVVVSQKDVLIAQVVDLIVRNPRCYPVGARLLSLLLKKEGEKARKEYLEKIIERCRMAPNSGHFELWLQRIARVFGINVDYEESLCRSIEDVVAGLKEVVNPWPWHWLQLPLRERMEKISILNLRTLGEQSVVISPFEAADLSSYASEDY